MVPCCKDADTQTAVDTQTAKDSPDALYSDVVSTENSSRHESRDQPKLHPLLHDRSRPNVANSPPSSNVTDRKCTVIVRNVKSRKLIKSFGEIKREFTRYYPLTKVVYAQVRVYLTRC